MNRENEEQKPVPQTLCGALQKEANCKCLVLSVLIYGCLAAVTWCRCANVPKIVLDFTTYPIKSTKHVSPCEDGYIYIPVAFMGMLYLVYLVECYHSPIRIDLLHAEAQSSVLAKLTQLKLAPPTIWWKAISYHYVRRKRQVMRYRNGDNFTTTQVYYERVNSHAASSLYFYDYCGSKDISKDLTLDPKIPITKITLSKGFAFSNVRSATEFEEARSRFFAEQEFRDDYMEMREGLDLGCNFGPATLVSVLGKPWFTRSYVYWCLSALLLSWPLRIIIECNTQYVDYQITKLFGVNYDTPTNIGVHTSASQLSAPGSYMLAPSYSEALLMESAGVPTTQVTASSAQSESIITPQHTDMVPSYSEALLYERAAAEYQPPPQYSPPVLVTATTVPVQRTNSCECPCHGIDASLVASHDNLCDDETWPNASSELTTTRLKRMSRTEHDDAAASTSTSQATTVTVAAGCTSSRNSLRAEARICESCLSDTSARRSVASTSRSHNDLTEVTAIATVASCSSSSSVSDRHQPRQTRCIVREYSEPDLRRQASDVMSEAAKCLRNNGRSLENIIESEEAENPLNLRQPSTQAKPIMMPSTSDEQASTSANNVESLASRSTGAIPKRGGCQTGNSVALTLHASNSSVHRVQVNPIAEVVKRLPSSRSTYFCLKSILKQNRRRFTLVTPEELQSLTSGETNNTATTMTQLRDNDDEIECSCDGCRTTTEIERPDSLSIDKNRPLSCQSLTYRRENSRTLIFASPIQVVCPSDPFGGRKMVKSEHPPDYEDALNLPVLTRLRRSIVEREQPTTITTTAVVTTSTTSVATAGTSSNFTASSASSRVWNKHRPNDSQTASTSSDNNTRTALITTTQLGRAETTISIPSYDGLTVPPDSRNSQQASTSSDERSPFLRLDELAATASGSGSSMDSMAQTRTNRGKSKPRLTRSLTERRTPSESRRRDRALRKSLTERVDMECRIAVRRGHVNIETSL